MRNLMDAMRGAGETVGGPPPLNKQDCQAYRLDTVEGIRTDPSSIPEAADLPEKIKIGFSLGQRPRSVDC